MEEEKNNKNIELENDEKIIPNIKGLDIDVAYKKLIDNNIKFNNKDTKSILSLITRKNHVIKTYPSIGTKINSDDEVIIIKSKGMYLPALLIIIFVIALISNTIIKNNKYLGNIDTSLSSYEGKNIYVKNGNLIVEEDNNSQSIEEKKIKGKDIKTDEKLQSKYTITNLTKEEQGASTIIKGHIKNESSSYSSFYIKIELYNDKDLAGTTTVFIKKLSKGEKTDFEASIVGDYKKSTINAYVESVK